MDEAWAKEVTELLKAIKHATEMNTARLDSMDGRMESMEGRMDSMESRMDSMQGDIKSLIDGQERHERLIEQLAVGYIENTSQIKAMKRSN